MREGTGTQASLALIHYAGRTALLKSFDHTSGLFRRLAGTRLIDREATAYARLEGVEGVPRMLDRPGRTSLIVTLVDGLSCGACRPDQLDAVFFDQLAAVLAATRARGVLHGDVKRNVIRAPDGRPWLVDFGASFVIGRGLAWLRPQIVRVAGQYDARAISKLKRDVAPHLLTADDHGRLTTPLPFSRVVKSAEWILQCGRQGVEWCVNRWSSG